MRSVCANFAGALQVTAGFVVHWHARLCGPAELVGREAIIMAHNVMAGLWVF